MNTPDAHGHDYYTPFYLLAMLANVLLLLAEGWRRGFPLRPWLTLVVASSVALILGTKLVTHPGGEWAAVLFGDGPASAARSILGGGVAAVLAVVALRRWLGLSWAVLDALALPLCGALVVQCLGCLLTGCCFGEPTAGAWGLTYAAGTPPWWAQVQAGLLPATAAQSLPTVPTQLLALLLCAAVGGVLLATRRRPWPVGSWLLLQTGLLLLGRFGQSFWRDPVGEPLAGAVHPVLGGQWLELQLWLLPLALLALGLWAWRVRQGASLAAPAPVVAVASVGPGRTLPVVLGLLLLTGVLGRHALTLPEVLVVRALLLAVLVGEAGVLAAATWYRRGPRLVGLPLSVLLAGAIVLTTAQAPAPQAAPDSTAVTRTTTFTGGGLSNYHEAEDDFLNSGGGCGGSERLAVQQQVRAGGAEVAFERAQASGQTRTWGAGVWAGQQRIDIRNLTPRSLATASPVTEFKPLLDVHLYGESHRQYGTLGVDLRLGMHAGALGYYSYFDHDESRGVTYLMPEAMVRVSGRNRLFGQADFCYGAENTLGAYAARLGVGATLGPRNGSRVLAGYAHSPHRPTSNLGFISARLALPGSSNLSLEPYYATDLGRHNSISLKLNYRIAR